MRKIAVTSQGPSLDDRVDPRFGRAAGFVVVNLETMETHYIDNGPSQAMAQGAGIQAAALVARAGVSCLLTGSVGPKALHALAAAGIQVGQNLEGLTVRDAVARFTGNQVETATAANQGGKMMPRFVRCQGPGGGSGGGMGRGGGRGGGSRPGPGGFCVCPSCGQKAPHQQGIPCLEIKCPQCGTVMTRER
jgi:predicted Fe-Mo cluster-binding NifX family protein